jgi:putative endonuclease
MYYVYILQSKRDRKLYVGCTNDLKQRLKLHNGGKIFSTRNRLPLILIYYEAFIDKHDAFNREQWLKTGWGRNQLKKILRNYLTGFNL